MPSDVESPMWTTARQEVRNPDAAADVPGLALPGGQRAAAGLLAAACFRPVLAGGLLAEGRPGGEGRPAPPAREAPPPAAAGGAGTPPRPAPAPTHTPPPPAAAARPAAPPPRGGRGGH